MSKTGFAPREPLTDTALPHLSIVTDIEKMCRIFQEQLSWFASGDKKIAAVRIRKFKYQPGRKCELLYAVRYTNGQSSERQRLVLTAHVLPHELAKVKFAEASRGMAKDGSVHRSLQFLPDLDMIVWGFPHDPKIKNLHRIVVAKELEKIIHVHRQQLALPPTARILEIDSRVVKYAPQDRCTVRHTLRFDSRDGAVAGERAVYSKSYSHKIDGRGIYELISNLWQSELCRNETLLIPEPLFYYPEANTIFLQDLAGKHIMEMLPRIDFESTAGQCGAALAGLQKSKLPTATFRSRKGELLEFDESISVLRKNNLASPDQLNALHARLHESLPRLPELPEVPNHGAFRLTQILLVGDRIALVDFDGFVRADPLLDAACFTAHLLYLVVKGDVRKEEALAAIRRFCREYADNVPWALHGEVLGWYVSILLISQHARKCVRLAKAEQGRKIAGLLEFAQDIMYTKMTLI